MDLTIRTGGPGFDGARFLRTAAAVVDCHRWACAMQLRYDRLGAAGFRRDAAAFERLMASLDPGPRDR